MYLSTEELQSASTEYLIKELEVINEEIQNRLYLPRSSTLEMLRVYRGRLITEIASRASDKDS